MVWKPALVRIIPSKPPSLISISPAMRFTYEYRAKTVPRDSAGAGWLGLAPGGRLILASSSGMRMRKFLRSDRSLDSAPSAAWDPSCHRRGLGGGLPSFFALAAEIIL